MSARFAVQLRMRTSHVVKCRKATLAEHVQYGSVLALCVIASSVVRKMSKLMFAACSNWLLHQKLCAQAASAA